MKVKPKFRSMMEAKQTSVQRGFIGSCESMQLEAISKKDIGPTDIFEITSKGGLTICRMV